MKRIEKGRALFHTRDSGGKHEMTPTQYVLWAIKVAKDEGLKFTGTPELITRMMQLEKPITEISFSISAFVETF
jgi:hypothetical protein